MTYLSLFVACLIAVVPLVVIVMASLKTGTEFNSGQVLDPPRDWLNFDNYATAFVRGECFRPSSTRRSSSSCR